MKRYCKHVDITNLEFIEKAVLACLNKRCKRLRNDTIRLFAWLINCRMRDAKKHLLERDSFYLDAVHRIAVHMQTALQSDTLILPHVVIRYKVDGNSGKKRKITVQHIWQLLYDHVAVMAMDELNKLLGARQVSGRKGMGIARGYKILRKWLRENKTGRLYYAKMDIHHYYESVNTSMLLLWLRRKIKNPKLVWLIFNLFNTGEAGLNIGSYLSHFAANLYLSDMWHYVSEKCKDIKFAFFYMDDMLFIGSNKRGLRADLQAVIQRLKSKALWIKPTWQIQRLRSIDILGFRFSRAGITLRKRIFRRARRAFIRVRRNFSRGIENTNRQLLRAVSYYGWIKRACFQADFKASLVYPTMRCIKKALTTDKLCHT